MGQEIGPIVVYSCKPPYKRLRVQPWHVGGVTCLTVKSGGASVWSGSNDFGIAKWTAIGDKVASYCAHTNGVRCMLSLGPHLWSGADDATVRVVRSYVLLIPCGNVVVHNVVHESATSTACVCDAARSAQTSKSAMFLDSHTYFHHCIGSPLTLLYQPKYHIALNP